eukprot:COSAG01_NODE_3710_length_5770_cov_10.433962_1_plen_224_part_00
MAIRAVLYSIVTSEWSTSILTSLRSRGTLRTAADVSAVVLSGVSGKTSGGRMRAARGAPPEHTDRAPDGSGGVGPLLHLRDVYDSSVRKARLRHVHGAHSRSRTHPGGPVYEVVLTSAGRQVRMGSPEPTPMVRTIPGPCQVVAIIAISTVDGWPMARPSELLKPSQQPHQLISHTAAQSAAPRAVDWCRSSTAHAACESATRAKGMQNEGHFPDESAEFSHC